MYIQNFLKIYFLPPAKYNTKPDAPECNMVSQCDAVASLLQMALLDMLYAKRL